MKSTARFVFLLGLIVVGGVVVNAWQYLGEASVDRKNLKDFPQQVGQWRQLGSDQEFDAATLSVLRASDYLMRNYRAADGQIANFYVGYYASQRDGATYHSPLNCLPGSGWIMSNPGEITISPEGKSSFVANRYLIQNGDHRELLVYWYQGRGRSVASEYWGKVYTVLDSVRLRRSDGAMVRVMVPAGDSEAKALESAADLSASAFSALSEFVPD
ncbi:MAG: exosortase C-terminal domain/associated protein EpsI [Pyrinomonadaceae bacterium]